jgi:hypothetical protein
MCRVLIRNVTYHPLSKLHLSDLSDQLQTKRGNSQMILKPTQKVRHLFNKNSLYDHSRSDFRGQNGVITIVSQKMDERTDQFMFGVSYCCPGDNFSKKIGIETALRRMGEWWFDHSRVPFRHEDIFRHALMTLLMNPNGIGPTFDRVPELPHWAEETIRWHLAGY